MAEPAALAQVGGADRDRVVAVDHPPLLVDRDQAIGITVEGDPDVGALGGDDRLQPGDVGGTAARVDVPAVGPIVDDHQLGTSPPEDRQR